jgi:hypothetical protein
LSRRVDFPDGGRGRAHRNGDARHQAAQYAVSDNQVRHGCIRTRQRVARGCGQRQQRAFRPDGAVHAGDAGGIADQMARRRAKQPKDRTRFAGRKAIGTWHEHTFAGPVAAFRACFDDFAASLVARNKRVAHAGEWRHLSGPEQFFRARRHA